MATETTPREVAIRTHRARNYAAKKAAGFECTTEGCRSRDRLLVVKIDGKLDVRCPQHRGGAKPEPGQWDESERFLEQLKAG